MVDEQDRVMEMVREELQRNPGISTEELRAKARKVDERVAAMTTRQFHARYPLQVKRRQAAGRARRRRGRGRSDRKAGNREAVRRELLGFARTLLEVEGTAAIVEVLASLDGMVDRLVKAAGG